MPLKKIFFSYSRQDASEFSLKLALDLKKRGFNVWIDQQDIRAGTEWDLEIEKALETCDCLLFVETAKSVVSNNVLDEVYYALGQNKKVIPLIVVDSKTPFRIQRIQHIDFTQDYHAGLNKLIQELQNSETNIFVDTPQAAALQKTFLQKNTKWLFAVAAIIVIITAALWYNTPPRQTLIKDAGNTNADKPATEDSIENDNTVAAISTETVRAAKKQVPPVKTKTDITANKKSITKPVKSSILDLAALGGEWRMKAVDLKTKSFNGYIKIEPAADNKFNIRSALQFFYIKPKDTAYLTIFNAFVNCANCVLQEEVKLVVEDIALGTQLYSILKNDVDGVGKAGDTVMNKGGNKSIRGAAVLQFKNNATALIKISRSTPAELEGSLIVKPFEYLFTFTKVD
ncbi:MAG: toll/interleukin-1 receptor domain-containing protein [Chitinophagaceae bacterium]|nr:toll/interleukin-1 receptor domain-containing protein [Chitinophagaceae bacterium]